MKNCKPIWWLPLLHRVLGWGVTMMGLWSAIALIFCVSPVAYEIWTGLTGDQEQDYWHIYVIISTSFFLLAACFIIAGGLIAGVFSGFYAPSTESLNPLRSQFFRSVCKDAFVGWLISTCVLTVTITSFLLFFSVSFSDDYGLALLIFLIVLFALSLYFSINRALRIAKEANRT